MKHKALFSKKTKEEVFNRDGGRCILCNGTPHSVHHVYFGLEANRDSNRNKPDRGTTLCFECHNQVHSCSIGTGVRQKCINYLLGKKNQ